MVSVQPSEVPVCFKTITKVLNTNRFVDEILHPQFVLQSKTYFVLEKKKKEKRKLKTNLSEKTGIKNRQTTFLISGM
jgi:hypothetical protein